MLKPMSIEEHIPMAGEAAAGPSEAPLNIPV